MSQLEQIETAILSLPSHDFEKLRQWFLNLDYELWDEQIERDIADGKLEALAAEAIAEFQAGHSLEI
jgi:tRNA A22 N-methylase